MGNSHQKNQNYAYFLGDPNNQPTGQTHVLRNAKISPEDPLPSMIFPGVDTLDKAFEYSVAKYPNQQMLGTKEGNTYRWRTYAEVKTISEYIAKGMKELDFCPDVVNDNDEVLHFLGIYAKNCEEWVMFDIASWYCMATVVPLYDTLGLDNFSYILDQTKITSILLAPDKLPKILSLIKAGNASNIKNLIVIGENITNNPEFAEHNVNLHSIQDVIQAGKKSTLQMGDFPRPTPDSICCLYYTSGTTSNPKGVRLCHRNILAESQGYAPWMKLNPKDTIISYLPLAHCFEKTSISSCISYGVRIGFYGGDVYKLKEDLQILQPTLMVSVPRLFNRFYDLICANTRTLTGFKKKLLDRAVRVKLQNLKRDGTVKHVVYDGIVFKKIRSVLGGNIRFMASGAAPISSDVLQFLKICFSCPISEAYGQTEVTGGCSMSMPYDEITGHAGPPLASCDIKLIDVPEMNYYSTDKDNAGNPIPRGEVCCRGPIVMQGYYQNKSLTKETLDSEGWVHTGDIGAILPLGRIKIIDRVKNLFKLQQGEYVAPEKLESCFVKSPYISQIFVYGDSFQNYLVAIIAIDVQPSLQWAKEKGMEITPQELCTHKEFERMIIENIKQLAKQANFNGFEIVQRVFLTTQPFTVENNTLTPSFKFKRYEIRKQFQNELNQMYLK